MIIYVYDVSSNSNIFSNGHFNHKKKMVFLKLKNGNLESIIEMLARMKSTYAANRFDFVSKKIYNIYIL